MHRNQGQSRHQSGPAPSAMAAVRPTAVRRRSGLMRHIARLCLMAVVAALALMLSACGSKVPITYTDPDYGFSFQYPGSWKIDESAPSELPMGVSKSVGAFNPDGTGVDDVGFDFVSADLYDIDKNGTGITPATLKTDFEGWLEDMKTSDSTMQIVEAPTPATIGGMTGYKATYTFTQQDKKLRSTEYVLLGNAIMYDLYLEAGEDNWAGDQEIFAAFLASFKPGP